MKTINLSHNNVNFTVTVDSETYNKLINDTHYASQYASEVYKALLSNNNTEEKQEKEEKQAEVNFKWTQSLIRLLVDIRLREESKFNRPTTKKKQLWQNIAKEINNINNVGVTGDMCDIKYRNLLATYRANKKKQNSTGESSISWEFFETFDMILGYKASSAPFTSMLGSSLEPEAHLSTSETDIEEDKRIDKNIIKKDSIEDSIQDNIKNIKNNNKETVTQKRKLFSVENYLMKKIQKDEYIQEKKMRLAVEKENTKKEMFAEKMRVKEKEIEAMLELVKVLKKD